MPHQISIYFQISHYYSNEIKTTITNYNPVRESSELWHKEWTFSVENRINIISQKNTKYVPSCDWMWIDAGKGMISDWNVNQHDDHREMKMIIRPKYNTHLCLSPLFNTSHYINYCTTTLSISVKSLYHHHHNTLFYHPTKNKWNETQINVEKNVFSITFCLLLQHRPVTVTI